ncbi:exported hypothetical protein [Microcystis aeruginosa PCC 9806]|uniref:Uncharacterized protein n=1 Tax=Microcystis aeruginosa PCC 9806 TaxID=1160282 RepID=I4GY96_MICAE|nr:exported hypothetical protein [Microcystis aeruginosa PCC 9806]
MRSLKKCLSIAFITLSLLLPFWGDNVQEQVKSPKFIDTLELIVQAIKIFVEED